ncbi:MAG: glutaredoxin family protein, partial [Candidatus Limnocylindrus sp.]
MEPQPITLYTRPECELCDEARGALRAVLAASPLPPAFREVDIEQDPALHQRLLTDIPAI